MNSIDDAYDVIVLGSGAGGMGAATVAATEGLSVLVIEKTDYVGGTTSYSGGMVWAPNNRKKSQVGSTDSLEDVQTYLNKIIGEGKGPVKLRKAFLERAGEAIDYYDRNTEVKLVPLDFYPDYYPDVPGATIRGRIMEPIPFDARVLGEDFKRLRPPLPEFTLFGDMMIARPDIVHFRRVFRSIKSFLRVTRLLTAYFLQRLRYHRGTKLVLGNALTGRLFKSLIDNKVPIHLNSTVEELIFEEGKVKGVKVSTKEGSKVIAAKCGIVLATGGFSHNPERRTKYLPIEASPFSATWKGGTGDGLKLGESAGGGVPPDSRNNAYWSPVSKFTRPNGEVGIYPHTVTDRGKPGAMAINENGHRFTNEANSYHEFVFGMFKTYKNRPSTPAYLICDSQTLYEYGLGAVKPKHIGLRHHLKTGYVIKAQTLDELAGKIGVDPGELGKTVQKYNEDAEKGVDSLFGRGSNIYHRYMGDPDIEPNPCMRPMKSAPFYAVKIYAGDLGTALGLNANEYAQVLNSEGKEIEGLYACGNDLNSIYDGTYPAPGITLGLALVFGYIAGRHIATTKLS